MTKEELATIVEFFKTITQNLDGIINDIHFFTGKLIGQEIIKAEENHSCYNTVIQTFQISKKEDMKYKGIKIRKRNDNRWYARVRIDTDYYKYIYGRTQEICLKNLKEYLKDFAPVEQRQKILKRTTFAEFYKIWLENEKKPFIKEKSYRTLELVYKNYLFKLEKKTLSQITASDIRTLINNTNYPNVKRKIYLTMKDVLRKAVQYDLIEVSPMDKVTAPAIKKNEKQALTKAEEQLFIARAKQSEYAVIYFLMLFEGLRTGEAKALAPADIKDDYLLVQHNLDDNGNLTSTKTSKKRKVPIFDNFKPYADMYRGESEDPIISKVNKHTAVSDYQNICKELNLKKSMYSLRHTFATRCEQAGISTKQTAHWLGHSSIETTLEYYINIDNDFEQANIKRKNDTDLTQK